MKLGSPLQQIAMGMVIVTLDPLFPPKPSPAWKVYDLIPDPLGWLLIASGLVALVRVNPTFSTARWLSYVAGVVSIPLSVPQLTHRLDASGQWFIQLPLVAFGIAFSHAVGTLAATQTPRDAYAAKRFGLLVWGFALTGVLPILALGAGMEELTLPAFVAIQFVGYAFSYFVFRVHRQEWLGGPGPLEIHPRTPEGRSPQG